VTVEDVTAVISKASGVPLKKMEKHEVARLLEMEKELPNGSSGRSRPCRPCPGHYGALGLT